MSSDPFGDEANPFASVEDYNPFTKGGSPQVVIRDIADTHREAPSSLVTSSPANYYDSTSIKLEEDRDSSDEGAPSYFGMKEDNPYTFDNSPAPTTTSRGVVSVQENEKRANDDLSVFEIEYYRQFFEVDTSEVMWRCARSMWPFKVDFINFVSTNPDFYGPFWIATTLIFMMAASANFAAYLADPIGWQYDFLKLTVGTGIIYSFAFGVPTLVWLYFKWADISTSLIELFCVYGYSLFVYIPVAILSIAPYKAVQWTFIGIGCLISTAFLVVNMFPPLRGKLAYAVPLVAVMAALHVGLGLVFMFYFFLYKTPLTPITPPTPTATPTPTPTTMMPGF